MKVIFLVLAYSECFLVFVIIFLTFMQIIITHETGISNLLVNSSLVSEDRKYRDDIRVVGIPATELAAEIGNPRGTNLIMLGALAEASELYDVDEVRAGMNHYFDKKGRNNPKNTEAFNKGVEAARNNG